jgi:peptide deformylase
MGGAASARAPRRRPFEDRDPRQSRNHEEKGAEWGEEGCLSFPGIWGNVLRAKWIRVKAQDGFGNPVEFEAEDLFARVLQHEIDHLDGQLFVNKMSPADQAVNRRKLEDMKARFSPSPAPAE